LLGKQAVVIGAGIGGLAAAGAVSDYFENVTVLERDKLAERAASQRLSRSCLCRPCARAHGGCVSDPRNRTSGVIKFSPQIRPPGAILFLI
jgi:predicted NAD/FAD-dependent oxidoreductase